MGTIIMLYVALFALLSLASASDRIINGVDVTDTSVAPWQVSLQKSGSHFCGGSLIAAGFVMSACHCKQNTGATVVMGTIYADTPGQSHHGMFTCHPSYSSSNNDYDYSILTLQSDADLTDSNVAVVAIAQKEYPGGMAAQITGWGLTNSNWLIPSWSVLLNANPTGEPVESATVCNASETQESTADAWETLAVHLSSSTQMMVSLTWLETPLSVPQTAPSTPQESGPRTSSSRTGSRESSLPNLLLIFVIVNRILVFHFNK